MVYARENSRIETGVADVYDYRLDTADGLRCQPRPVARTGGRCAVVRPRHDLVLDLIAHLRFHPRFDPVDVVEGGQFVYLVYRYGAREDSVIADLPIAHEDRL